MLWVSRRVISPVSSADVLGPLLVRGLLLASLISNDALLSRTAVLRPWHAGLPAVLPTHVLLALEVVFFWHDNPGLHFNADDNVLKPNRVPDRKSRSLDGSICNAVQHG